MSDPNPDLGRASIVDAAMAVASAAESHGHALFEAALALRQLVENVREQQGHGPFEPTVH